MAVEKRDFEFGSIMASARKRTRTEMFGRDVAFISLIWLLPAYNFSDPARFFLCVGEIS